MASAVLHAQALTGEAFAAFGEVIEAAGPEMEVNNDTAERFHDLAKIDASQQGGRPGISIFRARARSLPLPIRMLERHPLGSQAFVPMGGEPFIVVVAPPGDAPGPGDVRAFLSGPRQGINFARGVWHHPLIALSAGSEFLVVDRIGPGDNCEQYVLPDTLQLELSS